MDWFQFFIGCVLIAFSSRRLIRPETSVETVTGWTNRLAELNDGAPETYFEERPQLEAYPPSAFATEKWLRISSVIGVIVGIALIVLAFV